MEVELHGRMEVLYNHAEIMPAAPLIEGRRDEWRQLLDIKIMGVLDGISAVLPMVVKCGDNMKILVLNGSLRPKGNTVQMIAAFREVIYCLIKSPKRTV